MLFAVGVFLTVATLLLVHDLGPPSRPSTPIGGLMLLTDRATGEDPDVASVLVEIWPSGFDGLDEMVVQLHFEHPRRGLRWWLATSGQYAIPNDAPTEAFCLLRPQRVAKDEVRCPYDLPSRGSVGVAIHRGRELAVANDDRVFRLVGYDGYDAGTSSMVEGGVPQLAPEDPAAGEVKVMFPIDAPPRLSGGGDTYGAYAPVAAEDNGEFGAGERLPGRVSARSLLVDASTRENLDPAAVSSVRFQLESDLGFTNLMASSPSTASADQLVWTSGAIRRGPIRFVLHDAAKEHSILRRSFIAGVIASLAASSFFWWLDVLVRRRTA